MQCGCKNMLYDVCDARAVCTAAVSWAAANGGTALPTSSSSLCVCYTLGMINRCACETLGVCTVYRRLYLAIYVGVVGVYECCGIICFTSKEDASDGSRPYMNIYDRNYVMEQDKWMGILHRCEECVWVQCT